VTDPVPLPAPNRKAAFSLSVPDTRLALCVSMASLLCGLVGLGLPAWSHVPILPRFVVGLVCFGFSPGLILLGLLHRRGGAPTETLHLLVNAVALTFSCNLVLNVLLFLTHVSFRVLAIAYLTLQLAASLAIAWAAVRDASRWAFFSRRMRMTPQALPLAVSAALALVFAAAIYYTYNNAICGAPIEELVVLRKLADSARITYDGISFVKAQPSTYLFVPFQIFIVGVSIVSRLDVALVYPAFHAVTTALGLAGLLLLAWEAFGDGVAVGVLAAFLAVAMATDLIGLLVDLGLAAPCPNRYGFAGGVLMPLALLMFFATLKKGSHPLPSFLLVYLVVEMTFVHARETLFVLAWMAMTGLAMLPHAREMLGMIRRVALAMFATVVVLLAYKYANLALSSGLDQYVGLLTRGSRTALAGLVREHGLLGALWDPGPGQLTISFPEVDLRIPHAVGGYTSNLLFSWNRLYFPSRLVLPLVLLALPGFAVVARSRVEMALVGFLAAAGIVLLSGLIKLAISAAVGNPEILVCYSILYLTAFLLFANGLARISRAVAKWTSVPMGIVALGSLAAVVAAAHVDAVREAVFRAWNPRFALFLHGTTLAIVAFKSARPCPLFPPSPADPAPIERRAALAAAVLVLAYALPPIVKTTPWRRWTLRSAYPPSRFTGTLVRDLPLLVESNRIQGGLPVSIVQFLREGVPPQQVVIGRNTMAVVASTSHFAAILTTEKDTDVPATFICNWPYLLHDQVRPGPFQLLPYLELGDGFARLSHLVDDLGVDLAVVGPEESRQVERICATTPELQRRMKQLWASDAYAVYRMRRP